MPDMLLNNMRTFPVIEIGETLETPFGTVLLPITTMMARSSRSIEDVFVKDTQLTYLVTSWIIQRSGSFLLS